MSKFGQLSSNHSIWTDDWLVGEYSIGMSSTNTTAVQADGSLRLYQFLVPVDMTVDYIGCEVVTTPGGTGSVCRLGIYNDSSGTPSTLVLDAGTVDCTSTGVKSIAISQALSAGVYWCGAVPQGTPTPDPTMRVISTSAGQKRYGTAVVNQTRYCFTESGVTGALPATTTATLTSNQATIILLKRSA